jgi:hypothetical protein
VYRLATFGTYEETFFEENVYKLNLSKRVIDKQNPGRFGVSRGEEYLRRYFKEPKDDSEADEIARSEYENKDVVLDKLMKQSYQETGPKIVKLEQTETFHKDEEETYLTAEDTLAANAEAEKERKLREEGTYVEPRMGWGSSQISRGLAFNLFPEIDNTADSLLDGYPSPPSAGIQW